MSDQLFKQLKKIRQPSSNFMYHHCSVGHDNHKRTLVNRTIFGLNLNYMIYDWREYFITVDGNETISEHGKYCTGQDIISYSIDKAGVWEIEETAVMMALLRQNKTGVFMDFGSQIGYYSMIAAKLGYTVYSLDSSLENLELLFESASANDVVDQIYATCCQLTDKVLPIEDKDIQINLVKIDIEGAEQYAIKMLSKLLANGQIDNVIMEISPTFNDSYPDLVEQICGYGYEVYKIETDKEWLFRSDAYDVAGNKTLNTLRAYCNIPALGRREYVASLQQENFWFRKVQ